MRRCDDVVMPGMLFGNHRRRSIPCNNIRPSSNVGRWRHSTGDKQWNHWWPLLPTSVVVWYRSTDNWGFTMSKAWCKFHPANEKFSDDVAYALVFCNCTPYTMTTTRVLSGISERELRVPSTMYNSINNLTVLIDYRAILDIKIEFETHDLPLRPYCIFEPRYI